VCLAVPGKVVGISRRDGTLMGEVDFGGVAKDVCLEYLPEVTPGDYVIVHVGFAIQRLDERSALETLAAFEGLGLLEEEFTDPLTGPVDGTPVDGTPAGRPPSDEMPAGGMPSGGKRVAS
jgi:hydrogenase expression/formation protein HypC